MEGLLVVLLGLLRSEAISCGNILLINVRVTITVGLTDRVSVSQELIYFVFNTSCHENKVSFSKMIVLVLLVYIKIFSNFGSGR